jgi:hypothetical protein
VSCSSEESSTTTAESTTKTSASPATTKTSASPATTASTTPTQASASAGSLEKYARSLDASNANPVEQFDNNARVSVSHTQFGQPDDDATPTLFVQLFGRLLSVFIRLFAIFKPQWFGFDGDPCNVHRQSFRELSQMFLSVGAKLIATGKPLSPLDHELVFGSRGGHRIAPTGNVRAW